MAGALEHIRKFYPDVTAVVDAPQDITIKVTVQDCQKSKKGAPSECALARAFERRFDGAIISRTVSYLIKGSKAIRYMTPESVTREIVSFDRHHDFAPGQYYLKAPSGNEILGQRNRPQLHKNRVVKNPRKRHM